MAIPSDEFAARREAVAREAAERGLAGLLVFGRGGTAADYYGDVMYLSNHHSTFPLVPDAPIWSSRGHAAVIVPTSGPCVLVTDYVEDPEHPVHIDDVRVSPRLPQEVGATLRELGLTDGPLGLVGRECLPLATYQAVEEAAGGRLDAVFADEILQQQRLVKSDAELELMRTAATIGSGWMSTTLEALREGATEGDAVGEGLRFLAANGGLMYDVAIASGPRVQHYFGSAGIPHWDCSRRLARGDMAHVDTWGSVDGYYTDLARTTVVGREPSTAQREVLEGAVALVEHVIGGVRPGATFGDLCARGDRWLLDNGWAGDERHPTHGLYGHSLGLGTERPWIMAEDPTPLAAGMVIAVETIVSTPEGGAANFEQSMIVAEDGAELLTSACPTRWWD